MPGIGSLKLTKTEAYWEQNQLIAPKEEIVLDPMANKPSKAFYIFLADDLGVSVEQAILQYESFINQFISQTIASLTIGNLGTLHKNASQISWNNLYHSANYFNNITVATTSNTNEDTNGFAPERKISWWVWGIIFTVVSLTLIYVKQIM